MPYIVMYTPKPGLKNYSDIISAGGSEIKNAESYGLSGEAKKIADAYNRDNEEGQGAYVVVGVFVGTERIINNDN